MNKMIAAMVELNQKVLKSKLSVPFICILCTSATEATKLKILETS